MESGNHHVLESMHLLCCMRYSYNRWKLAIPNFNFFWKESVYWVFYQKIIFRSELENVIQQKYLKLFMLQKIIWSFIVWVIAKSEDRIRLDANMKKKDYRLDALLTTLLGVHQCQHVLLFVFPFSPIIIYVVDCNLIFYNSWITYK